MRKKRSFLPIFASPKTIKSCNNSRVNVFSLRELSLTFPPRWLSLHVSRCCSVGVFKPRKHPLEAGKKKKTSLDIPSAFAMCVVRLNMCLTAVR